MNQQVIAILERKLQEPALTSRPPPEEGKRPADPDWIVQVIREVRDGSP
jgi:hypothetical protein